MPPFLKDLHILFLISSEPAGVSYTSK